MRRSCSLHRMTLPSVSPRVFSVVPTDVSQVAWKGKFRLDANTVFVGFSWWDAKVCGCGLAGRRWSSCDGTFLGLLRKFMVAIYSTLEKTGCARARRGDDCSNMAFGGIIDEVSTRVVFLRL